MKGFTTATVCSAELKNDTSHNVIGKVEGTRRGTDLCCGEPQTAGGGPEAAMAEEALNGAHVGPGLEKMDRKRVTPPVWRDGPGEARSAMRPLARVSDGFCRVTG